LIDLFAQGVLGGAAGRLRLEAWNAPLDHFSPLATLDSSALSRGAASTLPSGQQLHLVTTFRAGRALLLRVGSRAGAQSSLSAALILPRGAGRYQIGTLLAQSTAGAMLALTLGGELALSPSWTLQALGLLGSNRAGLVGGGALKVSWQGGGALRKLSAFLSATPWEPNSLPLRYGAAATWQLSSDQLALRLAAGSGQAGAELQGRLPL
jgi:hypothetical protein